MTSNTQVLDDGVLQFYDVSAAEQGRYVCTASNIAGTVTAMAVLNVEGRTIAV